MTILATVQIVEINNKINESYTTQKNSRQVLQYEWTLRPRNSIGHILNASYGSSQRNDIYAEKQKTKRMNTCSDTNKIQIYQYAEVSSIFIHKLQKLRVIIWKKISIA